MKLLISLCHDNDRLTARNLACAAEHFSLIFAGSHRNHLTLPSRLLCSERNKRPVFRVSASRQVETTRNTSPLLHHLDVCHTFAPFKMRFNSKVYYFFVNKLCFPKNPAGYPMDSLPGPFCQL